MGAAKDSMPAIGIDCGAIVDVRPPADSREKADGVSPEEGCGIRISDRESAQQAN